MTHNLRNPKDKKYYGHTIPSDHKPQKWITTTKRRIKKGPPRKTIGPVELNPAYVEWKEKQKTKIAGINRNKYLKQKRKTID